MIHPTVALPWDNLPVANVYPNTSWQAPNRPPEIADLEESTSKEAIIAEIAKLDKSDREALNFGIGMGIATLIVFAQAGAVWIGGSAALVAVGIICATGPGSAVFITMGGIGLGLALYASLIGIYPAYLYVQQLRDVNKEMKERQYAKNKDWYAALQNIHQGERFVSDKDLKALFHRYQLRINAARLWNLAEAFEDEKKRAFEAYASGHKEKAQEIENNPRYFVEAPHTDSSGKTVFNKI